MILFIHSARPVHVVVESFFNILNGLESSFLILSLIFLTKCSRFGENFTSMQISPTTFMTSCKMSNSLVIDFTDRLRECPWQCMATAFGCSARIWEFAYISTFVSKYRKKICVLGLFSTFLVMSEQPWSPKSHFAHHYAYICA